MCSLITFSENDISKDEVVERRREVKLCVKENKEGILNLRVFENKVEST